LVFKLQVVSVLVKLADSQWRVSASLGHA